jgi:GTPase SAR1 family protein
MRDLYMKTGQGFLLVFSIASRTTFEELETLRDDIIRIKDDEDIPIVIVGNKADLEDQRSVDRAKAFALSQRWNAPYYEASARTRSRCQPRSIDGWCPLLTNPKPTSTSRSWTSAGKCYGGTTSTTTGETTRIRYEQTTRAPNGGAGRNGRKSAPFYEPAFFFLGVGVSLVRRRAGPATHKL